MVANKADSCRRLVHAEAIAVSATTGQGLERLREAIVETLAVESSARSPEITNVRHIALVERAGDALIRAERPLRGRRALSEEFVLADLQEARAAIEEVTGRRAPDDVLAHIFDASVSGSRCRRHDRST